ncbi:MAG: hypothetical protein E6Q44_06695 [Flavobacteriales bacterium]|jgi:hypothetical protein|nr:MAG: hypothetical protein E6Q44_06695 [Flavobacteriales bacterium]
MAKQQEECAGCGTPLTFWNSPNFGAGYLKDGERVCRNCFRSIARVEPSFGLRSRKDHTKASIQRILHPETEQTEQSRKEQENAQVGHRPDKILTNHLGGVVFLPRKVFDHCIVDEAKLSVVNMLDDLFKHPDEVWQLDADKTIQAWRYAKFYQEGALFGMVDTTRMEYLNIMDWYFLEFDQNAPDAPLRSAAIDAERTGTAIYSKFAGADPEAHDPVPVLLDAIKTGQDPAGALAAAHLAHARWWAMDCTDREYSLAELKDISEQRAFVLSSIATACVWNKEFAIADRIQPEFLLHTNLWVDKRREVVELYLTHLVFQQQWGRLDAIFERSEFRSAFLDYHDLYKSVQDPHYAFQSKQGPFLATVNKVNQYCRQIGREPLF